MRDLGKELLKRPNKTIYVSKDGKELIKSFDHEKVNKSEVLAEALLQARVEQTGLVSAPELIEVFKNGDDWCIGSKFISGKTLEQMMEEDKANEMKYLEKMLYLQLKVQSVVIDSMPSLTQKLQERISLSKGEIDASTRFELHTRLDSMPKHNKLCHCDFNPSNIIIADDGKEYITDWAHSAKGNGSADIVYTYFYFVLKGREDLGKKYLELFEKRTDTARQYVERWMPVIAAALAYRSEGEDKEKLLKMADVVEYQ
jgi:serine/threonine protein kinase